MNPALYLLIGLGIGAVVGLTIGWLFALRRLPDTRLEQTLREQLQSRETELKDLQKQCSQAESARADAEARRQSAEEHFKTFQEKSMADLRQAFQALSSEALQKTQPEFLRLANETFAKFQATAKGDLAGLVKPLEEHLKTYQQRLQQSETSQSKALGEVEKHLRLLSDQSQSLSNETLQLRRVLSSNQARGRWGEETLRRVVESAGLSPHCEFTEQTMAGDSKPDLIINLPADRFLIVDAKVPDLEFLSTLDSADPAKRAEGLREHANRLKSAIKSLADKDYPKEFPGSLDYVVLFVPAESLFSAALEGDRDLIAWAASKRVLLTTPASLIGLLRAISICWQQHAQTENAREIASAAEDLYSRVCTFFEHFEKVGANLKRAVSAYNDATSSYERRLRPSGERLLELGAANGHKQLAQISRIEEPLSIDRPETSKLLDL
jgi:DNA recombination protein RmuC